MAYVVPSLLISQEFNALPTVAANPLPALVMGPFYPPPGYIKNITLNSGGSGYTTAPAVNIVDPLGLGSGASATTTINSSGVVSAISLVTGGIGYSSSTYATIGTPAITATGFLTVGTNSGTNGGLLATITNGGSGYTSAPTVTPFTGAGATISSTITHTGTSPNIAITGLTITNSGYGYTQAPTISFSGGTGTPATATAILTNGAVTGYTITSGGAYSVVPTSVTVTAASLSNLTLTATVTNGVVSAVTATDSVDTWTSAPTFTIAPPTGTQATVTSVTIEATNTLTARTEQWVPAPYTSASSYVPFIGSFTSVSQIIAAFGDTSYLNTIAYGCLQALNNSNGTPVYYAVTTPTSVSITEEQAYDNILNVASNANTYYGLVPLTFNQAVQEDIAAHVNAMSQPANAKWRTAWFCTNSTGTVVSSLTPASFTGSQTEINTYLSNIVTSGANAISSSNPNAGLRRIHNVFPTIYTDANGITNQPGYFLAAGLAGLRSGSVPHQSLTNTQLIGPVAVPVVTNIYNQNSLNQLAGAGVWIITQSPNGGVCYTRHQLTGDTSNLNYREDSITANVDSISYGLQSVLSPFVGIYNISPGVLLQIQSAIDSQLSYYLTSTYTTRAGNQLLGYKIVSIQQDPTFVDQLDVVIQLQVPYPMNYIVVTLTI